MSMQYNQTDLPIKLGGIRDFSICKPNDTVILNDTGNYDTETLTSNIRSHSERIKCEVVVISNVVGVYFETLLFKPL